MSDLPNFKALRLDERHHFGLGDIRITIAQQDAIDAEIERLRDIEESARIWQHKCIQLQAEIERLSTKMCGDLSACESKATYIDFLEKRIGKYRAVVKEIAKYPSIEGSLARDALETNDEQ